MIKIIDTYFTKYVSTTVQHGNILKENVTGNVSIVQLQIWYKFAPTQKKWILQHLIMTRLYLDEQKWHKMQLQLVK